MAEKEKVRVVQHGVNGRRFGFPCQEKQGKVAPPGNFSDGRRIQATCLSCKTGFLGFELRKDERWAIRPVFFDISITPTV